MNILVTGGNGEIGKAIVDEFIYQGHQVFSPSSKELDLNSISSIESYFKKDNKINIFVHCAGINNPVPFLDLDDHSLEKTLNINSLSCIKITKFLLPSMIENQFGRIINISSLWSILSSPKRTAYSVSKAALDAFTRNLAVEFGSSNILVNSILPGFVDTKLTRKNLSDKRIAEIIEDTPIHRLIDMTDIAKTAYFLGSDKNYSITGQSIVVDGGYSIYR
jgi:3-oxoacyl-[acyl-carrier protein] reductase